MTSQAFKKSRCIYIFETKHFHPMFTLSYAGAIQECTNQIMTPYSGHQLIAANSNDKILKAAWEQRV
jgi:hypothetical protein